ncbi:UNVERIFIED_CONTAM: hypothetical protein Slati_0275500 [Sesamum latifolium]|uniref:Uncharacterized protein n=1 Tax=Sesamum latifolium TaxID=2727402 RepID=A0AAW2YDP7_9LAMI
MRRAFARLRAAQKGALGFAPATFSQNGVGLAPRSMARHLQLCREHDFGGHTWNKFRGNVFQWVFLSGPAGNHYKPDPIPIIIPWELTIFFSKVNYCYVNGKVEQAEKFFRSALEEAREGFGERDPHVASACNNLAEFFRLKKDFESAEPLYLEAINILEEHFGIDDIRVGAALHNLGQFYLIQRKLEKARVCYEIKRRVLGEAHTEYADTMYHLGTLCLGV